MTNVDYCKGCRIYSSEYKTACVDNSDGNCPCVRCIIKVMCRQACLEYDTFITDHQNYKARRL